MPVFNVWSAGVCARAVSGYVGDSPDCIYALDPTEEKTMYVSSDSTLDAKCGIQVNSDDDKGLYVDSGSCLKATSIGVTGDDWEETLDDCKVGGFPTFPDAVVPPPPQHDGSAAAGSLFGSAGACVRGLHPRL